MTFEKPYVVAIPIPSLDDEGEPLSTEEIDAWVKNALRELTECFGGAMPIPAPGMNVLDGTLLYEKNQVVVMAGCDSRDDFLLKKNRLEAFAVKMGRRLRQRYVFVLGVPSDSFLVEIDSGPEGSP